MRAGLEEDEGSGRETVASRPSSSRRAILGLVTFTVSVSLLSHARRISTVYFDTCAIP